MRQGQFYEALVTNITSLFLLILLLSSPPVWSGLVAAADRTRTHKKFMIMIEKQVRTSDSAATHFVVQPPVRWYSGTYCL